MEFRFWQRGGGSSPPKEYILSIKNKEVQFKINNTLEIIARVGFKKSINVYFKLINFKNRESLYQINEKRHRVVFVMRRGVGWICDAFLKASRADEQRHYELVGVRSKNIL